MLRDVRAPLKVCLAATSVLFTVGVGCGGAFTEGTVGPTGGEVCLPDDSVCIVVPPEGLATSDVLRLTPATDGPEGALSPSWDISPTRAKSLTFLKPATVSFSLSLADAGAVPSESLLRLYTREDGEWVPLGNPTIDRVKGRVLGEVMHLSPFVVLRADRLPDGGMPVQLDGGARDSGVVLPPFDAGTVRHDAGVPDAGRPDAGPIDAGAPDAGPPDAGPPDAGVVDAGVPDAGAPDAGPPDAGPHDAGVDAGVDAGPPDAGPVDAGTPDAGPVDAGTPDAGTPDAGPVDAGPGDSGVADAGVDAGAADAGDAG
jgi:hypothetical protein